MPESDLTLLRDAAIEAGRIATRYFKSDQQIWDKGSGQGPVSEADLEIDRMLKQRLSAARPDYGWLSEETEDDDKRLSAERVFIVDPIDGTRAFVNGQTTFAHSLAVAERGRIIAGVVHLPLRGFTYEATLGQGARLNGAPLAASARHQIAGAQVLAARPQLADDLWPRGAPPVERHFRSSLAYRMCLVAEGRFDAMLTLRDAWEWDIAAGALICTEAGASVTDKHGQPLQFNNPHPQTPGVLAGGPSVHKGLLRYLDIA